MIDDQKFLLQERVDCEISATSQSILNEHYQAFSLFVCFSIWPFLLHILLVCSCLTYNSLFAKSDLLPVLWIII